MPKLDRDGVEIYYEVHGRGTTTLLLTHGFSSTSAMWQGQVAALSKHYKLVLWDMRGHGQSGYPADPAAYSEALTVADMAALLDAVDGGSGGGKVIVGGLSLGGYMSLAFYRVYPERVRALLIIDTGPGFKKDAAREAWNRTARETGERFERDGLAVLKSASPERSSVSHRDASGLARAARGMSFSFNQRFVMIWLFRDNDPVSRKLAEKVLCITFVVSWFICLLLVPSRTSLIYTPCDQVCWRSATPVSSSPWPTLACLRSWSSGRTTRRSSPRPLTWRPRFLGRTRWWSRVRATLSISTSRRRSSRLSCRSLTASEKGNRSCKRGGLAAAAAGAAAASSCELCASLLFSLLGGGKRRRRAGEKLSWNLQRNKQEG